MKIRCRKQIGGRSRKHLHGLGYYNGPADGIFGPLTRASIRRFQDSTGEKETGLLTAAEAGRLVSRIGLGSGAGTQGNGDLRIPDAAVGQRQPTIRRVRNSKGMCLPPMPRRRRRTMRVRAVRPNETLGAQVIPALTDKSRAFARGARRSSRPAPSGTWCCLHCGWNISAAPPCGERRNPKAALGRAFVGQQKIRLTPMRLRAPLTKEILRGHPPEHWVDH